MLLRSPEDDGGGDGRFELLMVRRTSAARFMAGYWVFPGGAVDPADGDGQAGLRVAAVRELEEETGIVLAPDSELIPCARWITPEASPIRFDTWFYLAVAPDDADPQVDGLEIVERRWLAPARALALAGAGELSLAFPTRRELERLSGFESTEALLGEARTRADAIVAHRPIVTEEGKIVLPGDVGGA